MCRVSAPCIKVRVPFMVLSSSSMFPPSRQIGVVPRQAALPLAACLLILSPAPPAYCVADNVGSMSVSVWERASEGEREGAHCALSQFGRSCLSAQSSSAAVPLSAGRCSSVRVKLPFFVCVCLFLPLMLLLIPPPGGPNPSLSFYSLFLLDALVAQWMS